MGAPAVASGAASSVRSPRPLPTRPPRRRVRPNRALASGARPGPPSSSRPRSRGAGPARRRPPAARLAQPAMAGAALLPHAAVRTAGAVRDLSDSSLIFRLTRGRAWIAVLGTLLVGIVALNVLILSINTGAGQTGERIDALQRQNSSLRADLAQRLSGSRMQEAATSEGLVVPDPNQVEYLDARAGDAKRAAANLDAISP
jgi:hypothetical protein